MAYTQNEMIASGIFFMILPVIFVILRVTARRICGAGFSWDDYTIIGSLVSYTTSYCIKNYSLLILLDPK